MILAAFLLIAFSTSVEMAKVANVVSHDGAFRLEMHPPIAGTARSTLYRADGKLVRSFDWWSPEAYVCNTTGGLRIIRVDRLGSYRSHVIQIYSVDRVLRRYRWHDLGISRGDFSKITHAPKLDVQVTSGDEELVVIVHDRYFNTISLHDSRVSPKMNDLFFQGLKRFEEQGLSEEVKGRTTYLLGKFVGDPRGDGDLMCTNPWREGPGGRGVSVYPGFLRLRSAQTALIGRRAVVRLSGDLPDATVEAFALVPRQPWHDEEWVVSGRHSELQNH